MAEKQIQCIYGTRDILPGESPIWRRLETAARNVFQRAAYCEIRTPVFENTVLFVKGTGENTDIVQKEMYTFPSGEDATVTLRPEGTPPVVRAFIQHDLHKKQGFWKLYYMGAMFRRERPQKGRQRQFHQIGAEAIGSPSPLLDAEVIGIAASILSEFGLAEFKIKVNCIGCPACRPAFRDALRSFFAARKDSLCDDCKSRMDRNVLRLLDCKNRACKTIADEAPKVADHLCAGCAAHYASTRSGLDILGVEWMESPRLVRGLDYYTRTVFEITHEALGARDAVCGGGRYDNLVEELGGPPLPSVGFAIGAEATLLAWEELNKGTPSPPEQEIEVYVAALNDEARSFCFRVVSELRRKDISADLDYEGRSLKAQMRSANRLNAAFTAVVGETELQNGTVNLKQMSTGDSAQVPVAELADRIRESQLKGAGI
ncbi:MAG TPA: histidine--tRNA ligase [Candidatus Brocadiia bacterium]|nr:histidine--tRNA ligase [Candidatus Brocadiia bacterium]